jgi:hypothetical protein
MGDLKPFHYNSIGDAVAAVAALLEAKIGPTTTVADLYNSKSGQKGYCNLDYAHNRRSERWLHSD